MTDTDTDLSQYPNFTRIEKPEGVAGRENGTVSHVFQHEDHGQITIFETLRYDFVAIHKPVPNPEPDTDTTRYYRVDTDISIEASTLHLIDDDWSIEEFNAKLANRRIDKLTRNVSSE